MNIKSLHKSGIGEIQKLKLSNGLTVIFQEQHTVPIVAVDLWYKVGSRDEKPGKSGFAHLFEHLMFEGSENVGKSEHMKLITDVGGTVNGSTTQDRTNYWQVVPANQLELVLWLEADRMRSLNVNEENFENQRSTVKEERRLRIDNQPYMHALHELRDELIYENFAYKHSVIGSMTDLDNATLDDVQEFHRTYYSPNNAILSIVGDFDSGSASKLLEKYFGNIPMVENPPEVNLAEVKSRKEKYLIHNDNFAPFPALIFSYLAPDLKNSDHYKILLWEKILFEGESGRFYRQLVEDEQMALHVVGGRDGKFGPGSFFGFIQLAPECPMEKLKSKFYSIFQQTLDSAVPASELEKAKNLVYNDLVAKLELVRMRADQFCMYEMLYNDPTVLYSEIEHFTDITSLDMQQFALEYFTSTSRSIIEIVPQNGHALTKENGI